MSTIWTGHLLPCSFNGVPFAARSTRGGRRRFVAKHGAVNRVGQSGRPMGAESRTYHLAVSFVGAAFEGHKAFLNALDLADKSPVAATLVHPVWGTMPVFCEHDDPRVDFDKLVCDIDVTFFRHSPTPDVPLSVGPFVPSAPDLGESRAAIGRYTAQLAFLQVFNNQWISAGLALARLLSEAPGMISRSARAIGDALVNWSSSYFDGGFSTRQHHAELEQRYADSDDLLRAWMTIVRLPWPLFEAIAAGEQDYDGGVFVTGVRRPGEATVSARVHAALTMGAVWESTAALTSCRVFTEAVLAAQRDGGLDPASADAAAVLLRRRIARAHRLVGASMGHQAAPITGELGRQGDQIVRLLGHTRLRRPPTRTVTIERFPHALALLALDELGDASRAGEIAALNPHLRADLNRLPVGTELLVPA